MHADALLLSACCTYTLLCIIMYAVRLCAEVEWISYNSTYMWLIVVDTCTWLSCAIQSRVKEGALWPLNLQLLSPLATNIAIVIFYLDYCGVHVHRCTTAFTHVELTKARVLAWSFSPGCTLSFAVKSASAMALFSDKDQWSCWHGYSLVHTNTFFCALQEKSVWAWPCRSVTGCGLELGMCCIVLYCLPVRASLSIYYIHVITGIYVFVHTQGTTHLTAV